ncbi:MAG: sigma 54-interacting transcriptional regulator, partial [Oscillospiraceae bacterium]|nr:sigma 54-interacting transcriptional regulator [Oscillospiraceae bacterium]
AESPLMREVLQLATNIAEAESTVLISGESGTGKEVVAQYIHAQSGRKQKPLIIINCASLPETLLEAELFGYEKGAFTGASPVGKPGLFESADGGTLFLDEVNSLPLGLQGKLLRAIETKMVQRLGSTKSRKIDFRLLVATNESLDKLVTERKFRIDLYYRINVIHLHIPPLRERKEDIVPLTMHFLKLYCKKNNKQKTFSAQTLENMLEYTWPGNVRELKNFVERSVVMSFGETIETLNIPAIAAEGASVGVGMGGEQLLTKDKGQYPHEHMLQNGISLEKYLEDCEREYVQYALQTHKSTYAAARALGTSQTSVMRRKKKFGL